MEPQDKKDGRRAIARSLAGMVRELAALRGDAANWLSGPEYATTRRCLEDAHAAVKDARAAAEAALVEARRRKRSDEGR